MAASSTHESQFSDDSFSPESPCACAGRSDAYVTALAISCLTRALACRRRGRASAASLRRARAGVASPTPPRPAAPARRVLAARRSCPRCRTSARAARHPGCRRSGDAQRGAAVDADAARARGLTVVDLSDAGRPPCSTPRQPATAPVYRRPGRRSQRRRRPAARGRRAELPRALRRAALAVGAARAVSRGRGAAAATATFDTAKLLAVDEIATWGATTRAEGAGQAARARASGSRRRAPRPAAPTLEALADGATPRTAQGRQGAPALRGRARGVRRGREAARLRGAAGPAQAQGRPLRHRHAHGDARLPAEARGAWTRPTSSARRWRRWRGRCWRTTSRALRRVLAERAVHAGGFIEDGSVGDRRRRDAVVPDLPRRRRRAPPDSRSGDGRRPTRCSRASASRRRTTRWPSSAGTRRRLPLAERRGALPAAARVLRPARWTSSAEIDRGDVWYDFPFDAAGRAPAAAARALPVLHAVT